MSGRDFTRVLGADRRRRRPAVRAEAARPLHVAGGQQARLAQRRESDLGGEADLFIGERGKCDETPFTQAAILPAREAFNKSEKNVLRS